MGCKWGPYDLARSRGRRPWASRRAERGASWGPEDERKNQVIQTPFTPHFSFATPLSALILVFAFVSLTIIKSHRPHLPSLSISARLFCPGNAPIELPAEEASNCCQSVFFAADRIYNLWIDKLNCDSVGVLWLNWFVNCPYGPP